jgi:signal peptidase I
MRGAARAVLRLAGVAALLIWFVAFRPTGLGGPAGYVIVSGKSMLPTLAAGDLVLTERSDGYRPGDVVAFRVKGKLVIHRVVSGNGVAGYHTLGDNNAAEDPWQPTDADIVGKSRLVVPNGGIPLQALRNDPLLLACLVGATTLFLTLARNQQHRATPSTRSSCPTEVHVP